MPIGTIPFNPEIGAVQLGEKPKVAASGFSDYFAEMLSKANEKMKTAEEVSKEFAAGETNNIHETMLSVEQAVLAFRLVGTVRNRAIETYQEIMRMPV